MNERAKELAIEAVAGALVPMHRWETDPEMLEYVTELIVRECITQINEDVNCCLQTLGRQPPKRVHIISRTITFHIATPKKESSISSTT